MKGIESKKSSPPARYQSVTQLSRRVIESAANFTFPPNCGLCRRELNCNSAHGTDLCDTCRGVLLKDDQDACRRCGSPIGPNVDPIQGCNFCEREKFAFDRVIRLGIYRDHLRKACLWSKGNRAETLTAALSRLHWEQNETAFSEDQIDKIVPIPHYWLQRIYRFHNPSETLADVLAHNLHTPWTSHILSKVKWTRPQRSLSETRRRENVRNAFKVRRDWLVEGATVLLVDDIMTTGATAHEAARVLKRAGAQKVIVAVIAKATRRR